MACRIDWKGKPSVEKLIFLPRVDILKPFISHVEHRALKPIRKQEVARLWRNVEGEHRADTGDVIVQRKDGVKRAMFPDRILKSNDRVDASNEICAQVEGCRELVDVADRLPLQRCWPRIGDT